MIYLGWNVKLAAKFNHFTMKRSNPLIITEQGRTVDHFGGDRYAVRSKWFIVGVKSYIDFNSPGFTWTKGSSYFNQDCVVTKDRVESKFGNFIDLESDV